MSNLSQHKEVLIAAGVGAAILTAYCVYKRRKYPKKWKKIGEVTELICYPIKSCGPIYVSEINCTVIGFENNKLRDRIFMITKDGSFITGRGYPKIVKIQPQFEGNTMKLSAPEMADIAIDIDEVEKQPIIKSDVWGQEVSAIDCGDEVSRWISKYLNDDDDTGLRLMYYPLSVPTRDVREKNRRFTNLTKNDSGALHDATGYMVINESSVDDVNQKLTDLHTKPVQYRPNIVVKGPPAFQEDKWRLVKFGDEVVLDHVKPCTRCMFTNVDPDTGNRNMDDEPVKTLNTYRKFKELGDATGPVMGVNCAIKRTGIVRVGDPVYIPA